MKQVEEFEGVTFELIKVKYKRYFYITISMNIDFPCSPLPWGHAHSINDNLFFYFCDQICQFRIGNKHGPSFETHSTEEICQ